MRVRIASPAAHDLKDIIDYIAADDPNAAERVYRTIDGAAQRLGSFPNIGHAGRAPGTREWSVRSFPYVIVYRVDSDAVTVLAIFHAARDIADAIHVRIAGDRDSATPTDMLPFLDAASSAPPPPPPPPGDEID